MSSIPRDLSTPAPAYSKGAKRRRKRQARPEAPEGCDLAPTAKRQPNGQKRRNDDPRAVVKTARIRQTGVAPDDAAQPILGTDMGRCINVLASGEDRRQLVDSWGALSAARRNYLTRIIGRTGDPQSSSIAMLSEAMETDQGLTVDLRTPDERDDGARRAWAHWQDRINALAIPQHKWAIRGALDGFIGEGRLWLDQAPTPTGRAAVDALRKMCGEPR
jgi:hypothetical protein